MIVSRWLAMRDSSSVTWFQVGDRVRVNQGIVAKGMSLKGRVGVVSDAWEKCEVDPHCCCAELAEEDAAVTVSFGNFTYYFAEHELDKLPPAVAAVATAAPAQAALSVRDDLLYPPHLHADDRLVAFALVFPLLAYKVAALVFRQRLQPSLDFAILAAVLAAVSYSLSVVH